jgi:DNA-binding response OmpR family regulator
MGVIGRKFVPEAKLKVLIADDDAPTRILLRTAISQWGYDIIEAKDGEEAWAILQEDDAPRLLILDWLMPKIDGLELCVRCKAQVINHHPYIILLTQISGLENIIKGIEAGADEFLSKPFNMAELRSRLSTGARVVKFGNEILRKTSELNSYKQKVDFLLSEISKETEKNTNKNDAAKLQESLDKIKELARKFLQTK